jgi:hypothetical protein
MPKGNGAWPDQNKICASVRERTSEILIESAARSGNPRHAIEESSLAMGWLTSQVRD